jgi:hypothetical protein
MLPFYGKHRNSEYNLPREYRFFQGSINLRPDDFIHQVNIAEPGNHQHRQPREVLMQPADKINTLHIGHEKFHHNQVKRVIVGLSGQHHAFCRISFVGDENLKSFPIEMSFDRMAENLIVISDQYLVNAGMSHDILLKSYNDRYRPSLLPTADSLHPLADHCKTSANSDKGGTKRAACGNERVFLGKSRKLTGKPRHKYRSTGN